MVQTSILKQYTLAQSIIDMFLLTFQLERDIQCQPCYFVLVAELLSFRLRSCKDTKGIAINNTECKICQMDNTTFFVHDVKSLESYLSQFLLLEKISDLRLNLGK